MATVELAKFASGDERSGLLSFDGDPVERPVPGEVLVERPMKDETSVVRNVGVDALEGGVS